jgi:hypothetical protein
MTPGRNSYLHSPRVDSLPLYALVVRLPLMIYFACLEGLYGGVRIRAVERRRCRIYIANC